MKRITGLFEQIVDRRTLSIALHRAAKGKSNRSVVRDFVRNADENLDDLVNALRGETFRFDPYQHFSIRDTKSRIIHAPSFRDRVVHHAMIHATGPTFEQGACHHSYACRRQRGQHAAIAQARKWIRQGVWYLKVDIQKFYDSINHEILRTMLRRRFVERRLLSLFDRLLESYEVIPGQGIPIGALTSQYLGNFFLDAVDRWAKQTMGIRRYLRYMDDMLLIGCRESLHMVHKKMPDFLVLLDLQAKHGGQLNRCEQGVPWLGFVLYPNRQTLNQPGKERLRRKMNTLARSLVAGSIDQTEFQRRSQSLVAHAYPDQRTVRQACNQTNKFLLEN